MNEPRRIGLITLASEAGAAEYVRRLANALAAHTTLDVALACPADFEGLQGLDARIDAHPILPSSRASGKLGTARVLAAQTRAAIAWAGSYAPSLLHASFPGWGPSGVKLIRALRATAPLVLEVHDVVPHHWRLPRAMRAAEAHWYRQTYRAATTLIVHNERSASLLRTWAGCTAATHIIPHGEYALDGAPVERGDGGQPTHLLLFGRLRKNKGIHLAVEAVQRMRANGAGVTLTIAGTPYASELEYWRACRDMIARRPDGIDVVERYLADADVRTLLGAADAVVLPYAPEFHSGSGVAIMSLSNATPVVATRNAVDFGVELDDAAAFLIDEHSVAGVVRAVERLEERRAESRAAAAATALRIRESLSWDRLADLYAGVYESLDARTAVKAR